nr:MAG TPA: hypothetical protein [Bacteriophage sp.]DAY68797.1 MAG TPA: hypothetical protein [Caudoviricetes sp.]
MNLITCIIFLTSSNSPLKNTLSNVLVNNGSLLITIYNLDFNSFNGKSALSFII